MRKINLFFMYCISIIILCLFLSSPAFSQNNSGNTQTIKLGQNATINLNIPQNWSLSRNKTNDCIFTHNTNKEKIEIRLVNAYQKYSSVKKRGEITEKSFQDTEDGIKESLPTDFTIERNKGIDTIRNSEIPWMIWILKSKNKQKYMKGLFPYSKNKLFAIFIYFQDGAPFEDAEFLIEEIVKAIQNEGK